MKIIPAAERWNEGEQDWTFAESPSASISAWEQKEEHLLVSKALTVFLALHYFCACSDLSIFHEAYAFILQSEVLGVPLESSGLRFSSPRYCTSPP
jgi:hypothetical protein